MPTYGNTNEPGIITTVEAEYNVDTDDTAPTDLGLVGQAALSQTNENGADPNTVYMLTRPSRARTLFGPAEDSLLTQAVIDAFREGANPVYAVATEAVETTVDLSTEPETLDAPLSENPDDVTITIDTTTMDVTRTFETPADAEPGAGEVIYNPVTGEYNVDSETITGNDGDEAVYDAYDYTAAIDAMVANAGGEIDFLCAISENESVMSDVQVACQTLANEHNYAIALTGPGGTDIDPSQYEPGFDDSRTQVAYGTRFEDGTSLLAAYAGKRASLGLDRTPIKVVLDSPKSMLRHQAAALDRSGRASLIDANVVPLNDESGGIRIIDDPTTVSSDNQEEGTIDFGFTRLLIDYVMAVTRENERPFIGRLNEASVRNAFRDLVAEELTALQNSGSVLNYNLSVSPIDATRASLDMNVEVAKPIRFIENNISVGDAS